MIGHIWRTEHMSIKCSNIFAHVKNGCVQTKGRKRPGAPWDWSPAGLTEIKKHSRYRCGIFAGLGGMECQRLRIQSLKKQKNSNPL